MWNVLSFCRINVFSVGKDSVVKKNALLKGINNLKNGDTNSLCRSLYRSLNYWVNGGTSVHAHSQQNLINMAGSVESLSAKTVQNFDNCLPMACCNNTVNSKDDTTANDSTEATKYALHLRNKQNVTTNFADVYCKSCLNGKANCTAQCFWKYPKRRKKVKKRSKLAFLLAGACLSCKKSKDDESFDKADAVGNQEEHCDKRLNISSATDDVSVQTVKSVTESITCIVTEEPQAVEPIFTSDCDQGQEATRDVNAYLDQACKNVTSGLSKEEKSCHEIDLNNSEGFVFAELPYCSRPSSPEPPCAKRRRRKRKCSYAQGNKLQKEKGKRGTSSEEGDGNIKKRPNYFVAIQVSNPQIHSAVKEVQNHIINLEPRLQPALINPLTLHITILVCHISDSLELERACLALEESYDYLKVTMSEKPLYMSFEGLSNFQNKVLFAELKGDETLKRLNDMSYHIRKYYEQHGLDLSGNKETLIPHLTLAKLSKNPNLWKKGIKKIEPSLYEEHKDIKFGTQLAKGLQLLSMLKKKNKEGYYHCERELLFNIPDSAVSDAQRDYSAELNSALQKEKEAIRQRILLLSCKQLMPSAKVPIKEENDDGKGASKSSDGKEY